MKSPLRAIMGQNFYCSLLMQCILHQRRLSGSWFTLYSEYPAHIFRVALEPVIELNHVPIKKPVKSLVVRFDYVSDSYPCFFIVQASKTICVMKSERTG